MVLAWWISSLFVIHRVQYALFPAICQFHWFFAAISLSVQICCVLKWIRRLISFVLYLRLTRTPLCLIFIVSSRVLYDSVSVKPSSAKSIALPVSAQPHVSPLSSQLLPLPVWSTIQAIPHSPAHASLFLLWQRRRWVHHVELLVLQVLPDLHGESRCSKSPPRSKN